MNKTKLFKIIGAIIVLLFAFWLGSFTGGTNSKNHTEHKDEQATWTCSMHPQIQLPEFGQCPICFMDLIPLNADNSVSSTELKMSESAMKLAEIQTTKIGVSAAEKEIRLVGKLDFAETEIRRISAWTNGRIEKLNANFIGKEIDKNEQLMRIYSPELIAAQEEFLQSLGTSREKVASEKLLLLGITKSQIKHIKSQNSVMQTVEIVSPISGVLIEKFVSEGDYVKTGKPLFTMVNMESLWLNLEAHEQDIDGLKIGQLLEFSLKSFPGESFPGQIDFIEPTVETTRTTKIRVNVKNENLRLKAGMFATAIVKIPIQINGKNPLLVPASAVMQTGERAIVYVQNPDSDEPIFALREIKISTKVGDKFVVLDGLSEGELVVTNGAFKIDSAMQLEAKPSMMDYSPNLEKPKFSLNISDDLLEKIVGHYLELTKQLADDNFTKATDATMEIHKLTMGISGAEDLMAPTMRPNKTIKTLRNSFRDLSEIVIFAVKNSEISGDFQARFCMIEGGGNWLQKSGDAKNPYFGKTMSPCHAEIIWERNNAK
ncbi:MAG: efflux RND transporter periplasmic adaptor subunit [Candidatus Marinimicrobia bacterium]|nr:efflux RND transporter periplasmic adaptor subunit [Candidatus Neomarinimicrobiota bacterium]